MTLLIIFLLGCEWWSIYLGGSSVTVFFDLSILCCWNILSFWNGSIFLTGGFINYFSFGMYLMIDIYLGGLFVTAFCLNNLWCWNILSFWKVLKIFQQVALLIIFLWGVIDDRNQYGRFIYDGFLWFMWFVEIFCRFWRA